MNGKRHDNYGHIVQASSALSLVEREGFEARLAEGRRAANAAKEAAASAEARATAAEQARAAAEAAAETAGRLRRDVEAEAQAGIFRIPPHFSEHVRHDIGGLAMMLRCWAASPHGYAIGVSLTQQSHAHRCCF